MIPGKRGDNVLKSPINCDRGSKELNFGINNKASIFCVHSWSVIAWCVHHRGGSWHSINPGLTFQSGSSLESLMWWDHPPGGHGGRNNFIHSSDTFDAHLYQEWIEVERLRVVKAFRCCPIVSSKRLFTREGEGDIKCTYMDIFSGPTDVTLLITWVR